MDHLIPNLAKARSPFVQLISGIGISVVTIALEELLWQWLGPNPYVLLPMAAVISAFFGGGLLAGITTDILLTLYSFRFPSPYPWISQLIFFSTVFFGTFLVYKVQKKIRELAKSEARIEEAERLKFAAKAAKLGIWEWDIKNDYLTWDEQMLTFYGLNRDTFTGRVASWQKGLHPDDEQKTNEALGRALKGQGDFDLEFRVVHPDGATRTIKASGLVIRDKQGNPLKMFGLNQDVTEEHLSRKKTEELKAYFEAALVQSPAGVVIADAPSGLLRFANPAALAIAGGDESVLVKDVDISKYSRWRITELDGMPISNEDLPLAKATRRGESTTKKVVFVRPDGSKRVVFAQTSPIRRDDGSIMSGITVYLDITEQERLLEELKTAREEAEVAMKAKAKFLDIAAHELRTPVTAVSLLAQLTQRQVSKGEPADQTVLHRMRIQLDRLSRLVVDLLEVSKLDRGALELKCELTDLKTLVSDCQSTFQIQFPTRNIQFNAPSAPVNLMVDPIRIYEVMSNFLDNAIKYSPETSPIEIALEVEHEVVRFSVSDHGPGLSEGARQKLFSAFERGNKNEKTPGLGLGLFISRGIIGLHQGSIGVHSTPGNGSTFYFEIPQKSALRKTGT